MNIFTKDDYRKIQAWLKANSIKDSDLTSVNDTIPEEDTLVLVQKINGIFSNVKISIKNLINSTLSKVIINTIIANAVKVNNTLTVIASNVKIDNERGTTLQDIIDWTETIEKAAKGWNIEYQVPSIDEPTVRAKYVLKDSKGVPKGDVIKVYKDSAITNVYLGTTKDTCNENTGEVTKEPVQNNNEALSIVYRLDTGKYSLVNVPIGIFTREAEFDKYRGLGVTENGQVFIKLASDVESSNYLHFNDMGELSADGIENRILQDLGTIINSVANDGTMWGQYKKEEGTKDSPINEASRWGQYKQAEADRSGLLNIVSSKVNQLEQEQIQGGVYDVSTHNDGAVFESLQSLLSSSNLDTLIPVSVRHGGMSIRFVQSSDNKYVQYRLMSPTWSTAVANWQGVDDEPTAGSDNLVKSGGVDDVTNGLSQFVGKYNIAFEQGTIGMDGSLISSWSNRISSNMIKAPFMISLKKGYVILVVVYYNNKNEYISQSYPTQSNVFAYNGENRVKIVIRKFDDTDILPTDDVINEFIYTTNPNIQKKSVLTYDLFQGWIDSNYILLPSDSKVCTGYINALNTDVKVKTTDNIVIRTVFQYTSEYVFETNNNPLTNSYTLEKGHIYRVVFSKDVAGNTPITPEYISANVLIGQDVFVNEISDANINKTKGELFFKDNNSVKTITPTVHTSNNYVGWYDKTIYSNNAYRLTSSILLYAGDKITVVGVASNSVSVISITIPYTDLIIQSVEVRGKDTENPQTYEYVATDKCYVRVSIRDLGHTISVTRHSVGFPNVSLAAQATLQMLNINASECIIEAENGFVDRNGDLVEHKDYKHQVVHLESNQCVQLYGYVSQNAFAISKLENGIYSGLVLGRSELDSYIFAASAPIDVTLSFSTNYEHRIVIYSMKGKGDDIIGTSENYNDEPLSEIKETPGYAAIFTNVGVIGDSLASGAHNYKKNGVVTAGSNNYEFSWPQYMARLCGTYVYNLSTGGANAKTWCQDMGSERGWGYAKNHPFDTYIIALGVNAKSLTDVGNLDTDVDMNDYNNNADTFAGWMAGIIQRLKSVRPKAKFFVVTDPRANNPEFDDREQRLKQAGIVRQLAVKFDNVFVIDLLRYGYRVDAQFMQSGFWLYAHGTAAGYLLSAYTIMSYLDWIVRHNLKDFNDIAFIRNPNIAKEGDDVIWVEN